MTASPGPFRALRRPDGVWIVAAADDHMPDAAAIAAALNAVPDLERRITALKQSYELKVADLAKETERVSILARVLLDDHHSPEGYHAEGGRCRHCAALRKALRPAETEEADQ